MPKDGRPTKYSKAIVEKILFLARKGLTDLEISKTVDIHEATLNRWKLRHPEFCESLKTNKVGADEEVVRSMYEIANGYSHPETKAQWVTSDFMIDGEWRTVGRWEYAKLTKRYPPNERAGEFILTNRQPDKWKHQQHVAVKVSELDEMTLEQLKAEQKRLEEMEE